MASQRVKAPSFTTPQGTFVFPKLSEVGFGSKDYPAPEGVYEVTMRFQKGDPKVTAFLAKLQPIYEKALQNAKTKFDAQKAEARKKNPFKPNPLFTELLDQDTEEPTGEITVKFKTPASITAKEGKNKGKTWDNRPTVFDAKTNILIPGFRFQARDADQTIEDVHVKARPAIGGGTTGKVSFEVKLDKDGEPGYFVSGSGAAGISFVMTAAQVIELVTEGAKSAEDYGFENEDDEMEAGDAADATNDASSDGSDF